MPNWTRLVAAQVRRGRISRWLGTIGRSRHHSVTSIRIDTGPRITVDLKIVSTVLGGEEAGKEAIASGLQGSGQGQMQ